ncbi:hypothetical protein JW890_05985 [candidate division WOR-3 bacterium]|nr:hypothetical protein [candidate division WOR-3 bacterium]
MIHIIREPASEEVVREMLEELKTYIKLEVDIERNILAGGGVLHADCESALLEDGSDQANIWGADFNPNSYHITYDSLINIRPNQNNISLEIEDPKIRKKVFDIAKKLFKIP